MGLVDNNMEEREKKRAIVEERIRNGFDKLQMDVEKGPELAAKLYEMEIQRNMVLRGLIFFVKNDILTTILLLAIAAIVVFGPFLGDIIFGVVFLWFYEKSIMLFLVSYIFVRFIKKRNLDVLIVPGYVKQKDRSINVAGEWFLKVILADILYGAVVVGLLEQLPRGLSNEITLPIITIAPIFIIPGALLLLAFQKEKIPLLTFITLLVDGTAIIGLYTGLVLVVLLDIIFVFILLMKAMGLPFV